MLQELAQAHSLPKQVVRELLRQYRKQLAEDLVSNGKVVLTNIGTIETYTRKPRSFKLNGKYHDVKNTQAVRFTASDNLRKKLQESSET